MTRSGQAGARASILGKLGICLLSLWASNACSGSDQADDTTSVGNTASGNGPNAPIGNTPTGSNASVTSPVPSDPSKPASPTTQHEPAVTSSGIGEPGSSSAMPGATDPTGPTPDETGTAGAGGTSNSPNTPGDGEPSAPSGSPENTGGAPASAGGAGPGPETPAPVSVTDSVTHTQSTFTFNHFPIEVNSDFVWNGASTPGTQPTSTSFDTEVLENAYLKVTLVPSYGGRVLSILHKPTNRELLYQNPLGTPYLMGEDIFYYNYLVIMGGIFPSFPEPEHGKYWNQPYKFEVVSETPEAVTVRMSRQDDLDLAAGVPEKYDVGRTDVLVAVDVTLRAGRSNLELTTTLTNTRSEAVPAFEYWTVTTLAPGSTPGDTKIPLNTRIMAHMDQVHLLESSWSWFGDAEERVSDEIFKWHNLARFENWVDQGTGFANPSYSANWSGLLNDDAHMGVLCVSDNVETPGLKLWTFGKQSLDVDINDSTQWLRPTIEMWHGVTPEFWKRGSMTANEARHWSDNFFAILGLEDVTAASEYGAMQLTSTASGTDKTLTVNATLTVPDQTVSAVLRVNGSVVSEQDIVVSAKETTTLDATVAGADAPAGAVFEAEFLQGDKSLLKGQLTL
jgi:hypothetical protein